MALMFSESLDFASNFASPMLASELHSKIGERIIDKSPKKFLSASNFLSIICSTPLFHYVASTNPSQQGAFARSEVVNRKFNLECYMQLRSYHKYQNIQRISMTLVVNCFVQLY